MLSPDRSELRQNFFEYYSGKANPRDESKPVFEFQADENLRIILPGEQNIFADIERLRKRIIHPFRLRGTSTTYMEEARQTGLLSAKKVDSWFEDDIGSIATFRVLPADRRIPNPEFLYLFQLTATSALRYAMMHGEWDATLQYCDLKPETDDKLALARTMFEEEKTRFEMDEAVELVACYETPFYPTRLSLLKDYMGRELQATDRYTTIQSGGSYYADLDLARINLWDKPLAAFRENGFQPDQPVNKYSPLYLKVGQQAVADVIARLQQPDTSERQLMEEMSQPPFNVQPSVHGTVLYLLGEEVTLDLLKLLQNWSHNNEPYLQYA